MAMSCMYMTSLTLYLKKLLQPAATLQVMSKPVAPGEMEEIKLKKEQLAAFDGLEKITVKIEEA